MKFLGFRMVFAIKMLEKFFALSNAVTEDETFASVISLEIVRFCSDDGKNRM